METPAQSNIQGWIQRKILKETIRVKTSQMKPGHPKSFFLLFWHQTQLASLHSSFPAQNTTQWAAASSCPFQHLTLETHSKLQPLSPEAHSSNRSKIRVLTANHEPLIPPSAVLILKSSKASMLPALSLFSPQVEHSKLEVITFWVLPSKDLAKPHDNM